MTAAMRAADRFRHARILHGYAKGKIKWDPAYAAVAGLLRDSKLPLLDIGCGVGLLSAYLREAGCSQPILGIEPDAAKIQIALAKVAGAYPLLEFQTGSALMLPDFSGDIVMLDVLHYMTPAEQASVLKAVAGRIAPGGRALIRTTFRDSSWRYFATLVEEAFVRGSGWIRGGRCHFPLRRAIENIFQDQGLPLTISPMWGKTPFNSYLIEIRRPCAEGEPFHAKNVSASL
ncbi:MAG: class I SAM-dependent methyltransferase [Terrimicrobiaceae bacterium]